MLRYGYVSNGFADHSFEQMLQVLGHSGYQGVGITLDHHPLDPKNLTPARCREVRRQLEAAGLEPVIETGARYYLDAFRKHRPSLVSIDPEGRRLRVQYYERALEVAESLGARVVSLWSGAAQPGTASAACWDRLQQTLPTLLDRAHRAGITLAFEPEPGMFVENLSHYRELRERLPHPALRLTVDLGHLECSEPPPLDEELIRVVADVVNVHVDDIRGGRHEHLPLGQGTIDFPPLLRVLRDAAYRGLCLVELPRHSHEAPLQAQRSIVFLRNAETIAATHDGRG
ncbi:MAG: sugar phosphate isomerase/epimerase family protein [Planctomycetota bacterium]